MPIIDDHLKRLAEIDEQIAALDAQMDGQVRKRRGNPGSDAAQQVSQVKRQREELLDMRSQIEGDVLAIRQHESSAARVAHRAQGQETLQAVLAAGEHRVKVAESMDRAAGIFLAALDEMNALGTAARAGICEAAQAAIPFMSDLIDASDNDRLMDQRRLMIETTAPHAHGLAGPDLRYALVLFISQILQRVENADGIARTAPGWQYTPGESVLTFADAAKQAHERTDFNARRIAAALEFK